MEGLPDALDRVWDCETAARGPWHPDAFLHTALLGADYVPMAHLVVPTYLGVPLDQHRNKAMQLLLSVTDSPAERRVAERLDHCFRTCALCHGTMRPLESAQVRPYQVALHVLAGQQVDGEEWRVECVSGLLCRRCQTVSVMRLVVPQRDDWLTALRVMVHAVLEQRLELDFQSADLEEAAERLAQQLYSPLHVLRGAKHWRNLLRWRRDATCDHCGRVGGADVAACPGCGVLERCVSCALELRVYHHDRTTCSVLREGPLFDHSNLWYIALHTEELGLRVAKESAPAI